MKRRWIQRKDYCCTEMINTLYFAWSENWCFMKTALDIGRIRYKRRSPASPKPQRMKTKRLFGKELINLTRPNWWPDMYGIPHWNDGNTPRLSNTSISFLQSAIMIHFTAIRTLASGSVRLFRSPRLKYTSKNVVQTMHLNCSTECDRINGLQSLGQIYYWLSRRLNWKYKTSAFTSHSVI